ncbi:MAG: N-acetylmuramoyl-L-alanine amidase [Saccharofermentanales bacterium]
MKNQVKRKRYYLFLSLLALCLVCVFFSQPVIVKAEAPEDDTEAEAAESAAPVETESNSESTDLSLDFAGAGNPADETVKSENVPNEFSKNAVEDSETSSTDIIGDDNSLIAPETEFSGNNLDNPDSKENKITGSNAESQTTASSEIAGTEETSKSDQTRMENNEPNPTEAENIPEQTSATVGDEVSEPVTETVAENVSEETTETVAEDVLNETTGTVTEDVSEEITGTSEINEKRSITQNSSSEQTEPEQTEKDSEVPSISKTGTAEEVLYVQTRSLAVRPAKNSTELLGLLTQGTEISGYREGAWIRITYNGKTAYIAAKFTGTTPPAPQVEEILYVQTRSLAVRPAKNSTELLGLLTQGTKISGYREGVWIRITYNGKTGYIAAKFTDTTPPLILETFYTVNKVSVRPYKDAKTSLGVLPSGTLLKGYREGAWTRIEYKGKEAFIATRLTTKAGLGLILDISQWQDPELMDFDLISKQISGVILRIGTSDRVSGKGYFKDEHFERFYDEFTSRNVPVGGYWYSIAANRQEGIGEANEVLKHIQNKTFNLPIFWDTENDKFQKDVPAKLLTDAASGFITTLEGQGIYTGIYGSAWWLNNKIEMDRLNNYPVWVANYKTNSPAYSGEYGLWQFTNEARLAGYPYNLDLSIMYTDYSKTINSVGSEVFYVQSRSLAVRPAKDSTELLGLLAKGDPVYGRRENAWIRTTYNGQTAYIAAKFTDSTPPVTTDFYVQSRSLAVRPAKNSTVLLGKLTQGTKITGYREGVWIRTTYNGQTAFIAANFTDPAPTATPELFYVKSRTLAVRPAKNSEVLLGTLPRGTKITGYREGAWIRITYNGRTAYIAAKFTETVSSPKSVYLDPGHGGIDSGAFYNGIREETLNLKIADLVKTGLEKLNYRVIMSRTSDVYKDIYDRAADANSKQPDIYVSVHNNAATNSYANGIATFYYKYSKESPPVINKEKHNDPVRVEESRKLAEELHRILINDTGAVDQGVLRNAFVVLRETKMPAVLLELGFMSNPAELQKLKTSQYQKILANAVVKGIHNYFNL